MYLFPDIFYCSNWGRAKGVANCCIYNKTHLVFAALQTGKSILEKAFKRGRRPGMVAHTCNPSTLGGRGERITWGQEYETSLANIVKLVSTKNANISWAWWRAPIVPATRQVEAGKSLEPGRQRLQWAKITPLYSSLGEEQDSVQKKRKKITPSPPKFVRAEELKFVS